MVNLDDWPGVWGLGNGNGDGSDVLFLVDCQDDLLTGVWGMGHGPWSMRHTA